MINMLPNITVNIDSEIFTIPASVYVNQTVGEYYCNLLVYDSEMSNSYSTNIFVFGDPWLVAYYTYFGYSDMEIGFAQAKPFEQVNS